MVDTGISPTGSSKGPGPVVVSARMTARHSSVTNVPPLIDLYQRSESCLYSLFNQCTKVVKVKRLRRGASFLFLGGRAEWRCDVAVAWPVLP